MRMVLMVLVFHSAEGVALGYFSSTVGGGGGGRNPARMLLC